MAARPACYTCFFWERGRGAQNLGSCHRYPPTTHATPAGLRAFYPLTNAHEWCGEHAIDESVENRQAAGSR